MTDGDQRIALIVAKGLTAGESANVSALLMGQLALLSPGIYAEPVAGGDGLRHAGIRYSTVVLRGGPGQLASLAAAAEKEDLVSCVFSALGQTLNNAFETYSASLKETADIELVGVGLHGADEHVRGLTRKFSVLH